MINISAFIIVLELAFSTALFGQVGKNMIYIFYSFQILLRTQ